MLGFSRRVGKAFPNLLVGPGYVVDRMTMEQLVLVPVKGLVSVSASHLGLAVNTGML
jgi:hypothetical protein